MKNYDLSVLIPARNEEFLARTVEGLLKSIRGRTEIIVALDGQWADPAISDDPRVTIVFFPESIGQRAATNQAARLSRAKYVMKLDAHCIFDEGFDVKMMMDMKDNMTMIPTMYNLHAFDWVCTKCKDRQYQGPSEKYKKCDKCDGTREREIIWKPRFNRKSLTYRFDNTLHFQYFGELKDRPEAQTSDLIETMSAQGSCFMLTREKYWELNICDERHGSWGGQGTEVACATWLSGGRLVTTKKTYYSHMFRTQGGSFGFPYPLSGSEVEKARKYSRSLWLENSHPKQVRPLSWLLEKFWPVPGWTEEDLRKIQEKGSAFLSLRSKKFGVLSVIPSVPSSTTNYATPVSIDSNGQDVSIPTMSLSSLSSSNSTSSKDITGIRNQSEVVGVTANSNVTDVIQDRDISSLTPGDGTNNPGINKTMHSVANLIDSNASVPIDSSSSPNPTSASIINSDFRKQSGNGFSGQIVDSKHGDFHNTSLSQKGIVFYTDNRVRTKLAHKVQSQLKSIGLPIVSASLKPMPKMGKNIHLPLERGYLTMFKQQLAALEASDSEIIFMGEHDVIYHPSHFEFTPPEKNVFYYNVNVWKVSDYDGRALKVDVAQQVSGLVAYRQLLIDEYKRRIQRLQEAGEFKRRWGFEPGTKSLRRGGFSDYKAENFSSKYPNLDIRGDWNVTPNRWSKEQFRNQDNTKGWTESTVWKIPGWIMGETIMDIEPIL